ncbi:CHAT domain-containing protein [Sphingomonas bacterium]|uniref:CHAT domain-containing protein n=1 Tax=Sphingomonas bacterium TaxID=1895847 RepID=UPI00261FB286|nr:CHAT domain-containing protein [Sphingomonas bacterium]
MRIPPMLALASTAALGLALAGCASMRPGLVQQPNIYNLGRNAAGEPCTAARNYRDAAIVSEFDYSYSISCRNVAASRSLGLVRSLLTDESRASVAKTLNCGEARPVTLPAIGEVQARRCYDSVLAAQTVSFETRSRGRTIIVSTAEATLVPAEQAVRAITGRQALAADGDRAPTSAIKPAELAAVPGVQLAAESGFSDASVALADGISLNYKGLYVQASRTLNDALSRLPANAPAATRAELLLEAGLADSNIRFNSSAAEHFAQADALLPTVSGGRLGFLQQKRDAYRALDLLNQRKFREALASLDRLVSVVAPAGQPLSDAATVRLLNQPQGGAGDISASIAVPETGILQQLVLDAQAGWARSVALLAIGYEQESQVALDRALAAYRPLSTDRIDRTLVLWLGAALNRQQGRLQARRKQYPAAIASFDRALVELRRSAVSTQGTGNEPTIAETAVERAGIIAQQGGDPVRVRREYDQAVDALIQANESGSVTLPVGIERYFDLLVAESNKSPSPDTFERFFRAAQAVGEPAVARQLTQLQSVVTSDPAIGVKVRDRAELEREITGLRYDIAAAQQAGQPTAALEQRRQTSEAKLLALQAELAGSAKYRTIDDRPATIEDIRKALRPGEGFLKVVQLNRRAYGVFINAERAWIYPVAVPKAQLDALASSVRASIDGRLPVSLVPFKVAESYALFGLLTGPATDAVLKSTALVVDPAGPLQNLPASVLVTDRASVDAYSATAKAAPFDFSKVSFLASKAAISTAISPRSFLVARALPPSTAKQPFLGMGQHSAAAVGSGAPRQVNVGFGCTVDYAALTAASAQMPPIDRKELGIASTALGVPNAPEIIGAAFSDTAVEARTDLNDFEVIHFATHGLEEGQWGCDKSPPALVTSFGAESSDGLLSFSEIARLRLDANLVVLSACDTASGIKNEALARRSGQEEAGSTLEGLVRAFLTANSRAVMATFWKVSAEQETDQFIKSFYGAARQRTIGGSLQTAQRTLMANPEYSHPFYWGPYFVVGDSTKMMLSPASQAKIDAAAGAGKALAAR